jgi:D-sedoheptulose 7-phosphate isomerase
MSYKKFIENYFGANEKLRSLQDNFEEAVISLVNCYECGGKLLICGNGGSSADADHIVGELMKGFEQSRPLSEEVLRNFENVLGEDGINIGKKLQRSLPAISLTAHSALLTAISNDIGFDYVFAQQVIGYGRKGDVLMLLSTSGNSQNIINACIAAKATGIKTMGITGESGGKIKEFCDILLRIPEKNTAKVQEWTIQLYHLLCGVLELHFFGGDQNLQKSVASNL